MNKKIKSMKDNDVWNFVPLPKGLKLLIVNEYLKLKEIRKAM